MILISAVDRPERKWKDALPSGMKLPIPIFSVQEVIDSNRTEIVDISLLNFSNELSSVIQEKVDSSVEIRVFYEEGYEIAANRLKNKVKSTNKNLRINIINFDDTNYKTLLSKEIAFVFLGRQNSLKTLISNTSKNDYKMLIIPNWFKPNLDEIAPKGMNATNTNRYCATSKTFDNIVSRDAQTWRFITDIISEEIVTDSKGLINRVKHRIRSNFANENIVNSVTF